MIRGEEYNITYHLKNGHTITRSYSSDDILVHNSKVQECSTKIVNTDEYKASAVLINYLEAPPTFRKSEFRLLIKQVRL